MPVRFGEFVLDPESHQLRGLGREIHLTPRAFELLVLLVRARPRAVSKTEIKRRLWPDTHVGPGSLTVLTAEIRAALGDDAQDPRYIRTVFGHGYAFSAEVVEETPTASAPATGSLLRVVWGRRVLPLVEGDNVLGRDEDAAVHIDDASVSRRHALVRVRGDEVTIEDLGSKNGTYVKEKRLDGPVPLEDGDVFALGELALLFRSSALAGETATAGKAQD